MLSPQTLPEAERRILAAWAASCAEHVLHIFEEQAPRDDRPRELLARARAFARGDLGVAEGIRRRLSGGVPLDEMPGPAAAAAARAAGQAAGVVHMGAHALGAAAYAARAAELAAPEQAADARRDEIRWQLAHASQAVMSALRSLPAVGEDVSGPLGPGLLTSGALGQAVRQLQSLQVHVDNPGAAEAEPPAR